jgi:hypothetical protein
MTAPATASRPTAAEVEGAVRALLRGYSIALQYAANMPALGRSEVSEGSRRWGSRFFTTVYLETHVRKQLGGIQKGLRLRRLEATGTDEATSLGALAEELGQHLEPLFGWRRVGGLVARLPALVAAVPIVSAASTSFQEGVSLGDASRALLAGGGTALLLWIAVVWPSTRLGFRVKRAILAGGRDMRHPLMHDSTMIEWKGFAAPLPSIDVYAAENDVFRALGRRKPAEVPVDMLLGLAPYLAGAFSVFYVYELIHAISSGHFGKDTWQALTFGAVLALLPVGFLVYGRRSYHERPH